LTGDTLFADSFGRYDLYSGDLDTLKDSIHRLSAMEYDLTIYPGHGEAASLGCACAVSRRLLQM
jgi:glyoxylase-like metal-dependent hydrolase (beta-lactamase superfamily II)